MKTTLPSLIAAGRLLLLLALAPAAVAHAETTGHAGEFARLRALLGAKRGVEAETLAIGIVRRLSLGGTLDSLQLADALHGLGRARYHRRLFESDSTRDAARGALGIRVRHLPDGHLAIAEAEVLLAEVIASDDATTAFWLARHALESYESQPVPDDTLVATVCVDIGQIEQILGRPADAARSLERAREIRARRFGGHDIRLLSILNTLSEVYVEMGDLEIANERLAQALEVLERTPGHAPVQRSATLSRTVNVALALGDMSRAFASAQESAMISAAAGDSAEIVAAGANLAVVLVEFEDYEGALRVLSPLVPLSARVFGPNHWATAAVMQVMGNAALAVRDTTLALRMFREALAILQQDRGSLGESVLALCRLGEGEVLQMQGRHTEAREACERGTRANDAARQPSRTTLVTSRAMMIRILESLGDTAGIDSVRRDLAGLRERQRFAGSATEPVIDHWLARADRGLGRDHDAWTGALAAEAGIRGVLRLNLESLADARALQLARRRSYMLDQVLELAAADSSRWEPAWDRLVRTRGLVRAGLAHRRLPRELHSDSALVRLHAAWVAAQRRLARRLVAARATAADSAARVGLRAAAESAEAAYARALADRGATRPATDVGLADVRARLAPGEALVAFSEVEARDGSRSLHAFVALGGVAALHRLEIGACDRLRALIEPWRERLAVPPGPAGRNASAAERACRRLGERVRREVWDRLSPLLGGAERVAIVPDGPLVDLPWHALPAGTNDYLVERGPLVRLLDAERDLLASPPVRARGSLLALGDPDFAARRPAPGAGTPATAGMPRTPRDPCAEALPASFPPLPATRTEAVEVARAWSGAVAAGPEVLLGADATELAFGREAPDAEIVHIATHGFVAGELCRAGAAGTRGVGGVVALETPVARRPVRRAAPVRAEAGIANPWLGRRVWLALAGADHAREAAGDADDGLLTAEEVVTLDLGGTEWVVLSACHSGLAESWSREGSLGMRRAFALAGARCVIASQWAVEDAATADWMRLLYTARAQGRVRASEALQSACRGSLSARRLAGRSTHPFYWAAFTATGD